MSVVEYLRAGVELLPVLAKFTIAMALIIVIPRLARRVRLPEAVEDRPAKSKLEFMSSALFVPCFFVVTGFLIDPMALARSVTSDFLLAGGLIGALVVGKWMAAEAAGRAFGYAPAARTTMWSLTLPQLAATLAATLVATKTFNAAGQPLIDGRILNTVLLIVLVTAIVGPILTQHFAPRMRKSEPGASAAIDAPT